MKTKRRRGFRQATLGTVLTFGVLFAVNRIRKSLGRVESDHTGVKTTENTLKLGIHRDVIDALPRRGVRYDNGRANEPMNLVLLGTAEAVYDRWIKAGWYPADPITPWHLLRAWAALIFNLPYRYGPVTPIMAGGRVQAMSFQKPTSQNTFRQRHHARVWSTPYSSTNGEPVWIAHASYDIGIKTIFKIPPAHEIAPELDDERQVVVTDLMKGGAKLRGYVSLQSAHEGSNAFGDDFITDGKAAVMEME